MAATALALAGVVDDDATLDGTNLIPYLTGETTTPPHDALFWALGGQAAVRKGNWKWLTTQTSGQFLFDLNSPSPERHNLVDERPELAAQLNAELQEWLDSLKKRGVVPEKRLKLEEFRYRAHFRN